ncbi:MAG TPA: 16S rRNA (adenine(1518)-N(6)/adenine(1519)-N(6))-dimethyltransferase RsmA [Candidatus Saccharibacteria bacterium]|nr:16S rRNA (adenine(1518)-N(6)/adenine(1519)-N(6))-dimethyltransferase RsmA [Candidatus Saccharibacteria bacterium]
MALQNKKSLGQHWLRDRTVLAKIADSANLESNDTVVEIGPGLGTLTSELLKRASKVIAIELDSDLARKLPGQFPGKNLEVIQTDFLDYDLSKLPSGYKVVGNVPYYITGKIIQKLLSTANKPSQIVLLVQKEVAERIIAKHGDMSLLSVSVQINAEATLGDIVQAHFFTPIPKVDSQVVILKVLKKSLISDIDEAKFFQVVKAGFSSKRKKLRSSLAGGLGISKSESENLLKTSGIDPNSRAEKLTITDWLNLTNTISK